MDAIVLKSGLSFGEAIEALKNEYKVSRQGWSGKNMFLWLNKGSFPPEHPAAYNTAFSYIDGVRSDLFEQGNTGTVTRLPNINMCTATGSTITGWLASQTDILAEDWCVIE